MLQQLRSTRHNLGARVVGLNLKAKTTLVIDSCLSLKQWQILLLTAALTSAAYPEIPNVLRNVVLTCYKLDVQLSPTCANALLVGRPISSLTTCRLL